MCFNAEVSINTFIFSLFAAIFAFFNKVISIDIFLFILSFAIMQLVEWLAWNIINSGQKVVTGFIAYLFPIVTVVIQPIVAALVFNTQYKTVVARIGEKWAGIAKKVIYTAILCLWIYTVYDYIWVGHRPNVYKSEINGHLKWNLFHDFNLFEGTLIFVSYLLAYLLPMILSLPYIMAVIFIVTFVYSFVTYLHAKTWGTIWCYSANLISLVIITQVFWKNFCSSI